MCIDLLRADMDPVSKIPESLKTKCSFVSFKYQHLNDFALIQKLGTLSKGVRKVDVGGRYNFDF